MQVGYCQQGDILPIFGIKFIRYEVRKEAKDGTSVPALRREDLIRQVR